MMQAYECYWRLLFYVLIMLSYFINNLYINTFSLTTEYLVCYLLLKTKGTSKLVYRGSTISIYTDGNIYGNSV